MGQKKETQTLMYEIMSFTNEKCDDYNFCGWVELVALYKTIGISLAKHLTGWVETKKCVAERRKEQ